MSDTASTAPKATSSSTFFVFVLGLVLGLVVGALAGAFLPARLAGNDAIPKLGATPDPKSGTSPAATTRDERDPPPAPALAPGTPAPAGEAAKLDPKATTPTPPGAPKQ